MTPIGENPGNRVSTIVVELERNWLVMTRVMLPSSTDDCRTTLARTSCPTVWLLEPLGDRSLPEGASEQYFHKITSLVKGVVIVKHSCKFGKGIDCIGSPRDRHKYHYCIRSLKETVINTILTYRLIYNHKDWMKALKAQKRNRSSTSRKAQTADR